MRSEAYAEPGRGIERGATNADSRKGSSAHADTRVRLERLGGLLTRLRTAVDADQAQLDAVANALVEGIRTIRLLPLSTIFALFPRMVRDLAREQAKAIQLVIEGGEVAVDKRVVEELKDPLMHILRNAIDHGIETPAERARHGKPVPASLRLSAYQTGTSITVEVQDDGRGLDLETIKHTALQRSICREDELAAMTPGQIQALIFIAGFSTSPLVTDVSGRGVGLDVVRTQVAHLKGTIQVESSAGVGCTFRIQLPMTLVTTRVLIVSAVGRLYALPVEFVHTMRLVSPQEIFAIEGRATIVFETRPVSVARLSELLALPTNKTGSQEQGTGSSSSPGAPELLPCIILSVGGEQLGLFVDALLDEQEVVLKPHSPILKRVRNVSGATILETGQICMVLNPQDLLKTARQQAALVVSERVSAEVQKKPVLLLMEDSILIRTREQRILESAGYEVVTAVDGVDALEKLKTRSFDAVVADVQTPRMDGLTLTARIRQDKHCQELPIILVTALATEEDKRKGLEAGANAYLTKPGFDQKVLLDTLRRLV
jgi:two-component system chemotaxis sensor kinase CheA